jgi:hypothetical protein
MGAAPGVIHTGRFFVLIPLEAQGLKNPLARRPGLVISTFGLAEIISCMPGGLVKIYIGNVGQKEDFMHSNFQMEISLPWIDAAFT